MNNTNRLLIILIILLVMILVACVVICWAIFGRAPEIIEPDYPAGETEKNQLPSGGEPEDKLEAEEGGGAVGLTYSPKAVIDLSEKTLMLNFENPGRSTEDMVLQVCIGDVLVAESARITPGHKVLTLDAEIKALQSLREGVYTATYFVYYFDTESSEKALVITELPNIELTVAE